MEWSAALEATELATALRRSTWLYPLVNAAHLLGVALVVGAMVPLDLRLLGVWPRTALQPLWQVLIACAVAGLLLAIASGTLLFITRASDYLASPLFGAKMAAVALGVANAVLLRIGGPARSALAGERSSPRLRLAAAVSLLAWPAALLLGRLIGYF